MISDAELYENLNEAQKEAVLHRDGPLVVFAGAGSGKTRVITTRVAHLTRNGVMPWNILAVTFTNKAAGEMRDRVTTICPEASTALIATFHSACARWLREFAVYLGFTGDFVIYDDSDASAAIKIILKQISPDKEILKLASEMKSFIQEVKTAGLFPKDVERMQGQMVIEVPDGGLRVYKAYQEYLARCNAMDFNDLLLNMLLLLRTNPDVKQVLQKRFTYVMVDEYQDTNRAQMELIGHLVEHSQNLFVVGDDDQSIYSWRGATPGNIIEFERYYPTAKRVLLDINYRSSSTIVDAAAQMIQNNINRVSKTSRTLNESGDKIEVHIDADGELEAYTIVETIAAELKTFSYGEIAIFYRTNSQSRMIEDALLRQNMPYRIFGAVKFYERAEIKDVMAFIRLLVNENDDVALRRIINVPARGIGDKAVRDLEELAKKQGVAMLAAVQYAVANQIPRLGTKLALFTECFMAIKQQAADAELDQVVQIILDVLDYTTYLKKKYPDQYLDKTENVHELSNALADYQTKNLTARLADWLQDVSLVREDVQSLEGPGVSLMTLHMAKGLEFERVYIAGLEDGMLPHRSNLDDPYLLEEERRLFYVGMTRARKKLSLLGALRRRVYNQVMVGQPSRFLKEIPNKFLSSPIADDRQDFSSGSVKYEPYVDYVEQSDSEQRVEIGMTVLHSAFGKGEVEEIEQEFGAIKVLVNFWEFGRRRVTIGQLRVVGA
jgi:DNA helicase II / ATP-dependent DNA helicase PcrA